MNGLIVKPKRVDLILSGAKTWARRFKRLTVMSKENAPRAWDGNFLREP